MGKQSARLYYQGRDHKDIYYNGAYHNAMMFNGELVWRKLRDEEHYVINIQRFEGSAQSWNYFEAILYPKKRVMHVKSLLDMMYFSHNDEMVFGNYHRTQSTSNSNIVISSSDAKLYRRNSVMDYLSGGVIPVRGGFLYVNNTDYRTSLVRIGADGTVNERKIGKIAHEHPKCAYIGGECPDGAVITRNNGTLILRIDGTVSPRLDTVSYSVCGYGNGMYVLLQALRGVNGNNYQYGLYACVIRPDHTWRQYAAPISYYYSSKMIAMLYRGDKFLIYIHAAAYAGANERLRIFETRDFRHFNEVPVSVKKLSVGYVNSGAGYSHIDLILDSSAQEEDGHYRCPDYVISNNACFKNQKKVDSDGLVFFIQGHEYSGYVYTTVYIDNLYFEESDGNFAVYGVNDVGDIQEVY